MKLNPDRPFKSISEQITLLKKRNLVITDEEFVASVLNSVGYYSLINGYKSEIMFGNNSFLPGTTFEDIHQLYLYDTEVCATLLRYVLVVEQALKTRLSYFVGRDIGVFPSDYADPTRYSGVYSDISYITGAIRKRVAKPRDPSVKHYKNTKNHLPPWVIVHDLTFNEIVSWYKILPSTLKIEVCDAFVGYTGFREAQRKELLLASIKMLVQFRNFISHGRRAFGDHFTVQLPNSILKLLSDSTLTKVEYNKGIGQKGLFAIMLIVPLLLREDKILLIYLSIPSLRFYALRTK